MTIIAIIFTNFVAMKISAVILTKNNEKTISKALDSLSFADEIVVVDSGSTDKTVSLANLAGARVIFHPWEGYVKQRRFAIQQATYDWVFVLDSDEEVSKELASWVQNFNPEIAKINGVWIQRKMVFYGQSINYVWHNELRLRFFRKDCAEVGGDDPHDKIVVKGKTIKAPYPIYHYSYESFLDQINKLVKHAHTASLILTKKSTLTLTFKMLLSPILRFFKLYGLNYGVMLGLNGLILCVNESFYVFLKYALALDLKLNKKLKPTN